MTSAAVEAEVRAASAEWSEAIQRRDVRAVEQFLGHEYSLMAPGFGEVARSRWLEVLAEYVIDIYDFSDVKIHAYGDDTAVMRSKYTQKATVGGQDRSGSMLVTDVWVKRDGRWQVVARHTSWLDAS
jgi:ketosteroid isomerase-like protein